MHPADCPAWEYTEYDNYDDILKSEITSILLDLRTAKLDTLRAAADTRNIHYRLFQNLTPIETPYYAGHYRGEAFRCLKEYEVRIRTDPTVGLPPHQVLGHMVELASIIAASVAGLDDGFKIPNVQLSLRQKVLYAVAVACRIFEYFLRIHPYANGNGHAARFCIWAILGRYGLWPVRWPIHPRPVDPPYVNLIIEYRRGNPQPLEEFILRCLSL